MSIRIFTLLSLFTLLLLPPVYAQQITVKVIAKTIEKQFEWETSDQVKVEGEKAKINIRGWDESTVKVVLKQISKAPEKAVAERELAYQRYILEKRKGVIYIKNYFAVPKNVKNIESIQKSEFEIWVPRKIKLQVTNNYGNTTLQMMAGDVNLNTKYGNVQLSNYSGNASVKSYFGDLTVNNFAGSLFVNSNHTMVVLSKVAGDIELNSVLGDIILTYSSKITRCKIRASKADVTINRIVWQNIYIKLYSHYGDILLPSSQDQQLTKLSDSKLSFKKGEKNQASHIDIETSFGKIIVL